MTCGFDKDLVSAYHDGELDAGQSALVEAHLEGCPSCAAWLERLRDLSRTAREPALHYDAPAYLEGRIREAVRENVREMRRPHYAYWRWAAVAAGLVLAAGLVWGLIGYRTRAASERAIGEAVVSNHIRSLLATHLFDVPSTDRHTVKPWFDGKLDFSPDVRDLAPQGFRLAGGRLDYLDGRTVAALVFQRRLHVINLFVWPSGAAPARPAPVVSEHGYNVVHWAADGMTYWAVADIPATELEEFGRLYNN